MIEKKGRGEGLGGKRKMYQNSHIKNQTGNLFHTLVIGQVFKCSYYQRVNAATVKFMKFGIVPVSSLNYDYLILLVVIYSYKSKPYCL